MYKVFLKKITSLVFALLFMSQIAFADSLLEEGQPGRRIIRYCVDGSKKISYLPRVSKSGKVTRSRPCDAKLICADSVKANKICAHCIAAKKQNVKDLMAECITTQTLNAQQIFLDGLDLNCVFKEPTILTQGSSFDIEIGGIPLKPKAVNQEVFDALLIVSEEVRLEYQERWELGREKLNLPPNPGVLITGYKTIEPAVKGCAEGIVNTVNSVGFDFEIVNPNVVLNDILLASIYIQIAWIEQATDDIIVAELQVGNRQFQASIDSVATASQLPFGEKFNGALQLDTNVLKEALVNMPDLDNTPGLQLILYIEDGLQVFTPGEPPTGARSSSSRTTDPRVVRDSLNIRQFSTTVPDVIGEFILDAVDEIFEADLDIGGIFEESSNTVPLNFVIDQAPEAGTEVPVGSFVDLLISDGPIQQQLKCFFIQRSQDAF